MGIEVGVGVGVGIGISVGVGVGGIGVGVGGIGVGVGGSITWTEILASGPLHAYLGGASTQSPLHSAKLSFQARQ